MSNKELIQNTIKTSLQCINLFWLFLFFQMMLGFTHALSTQFAFKGVDEKAIPINFLFMPLFSLISIFVVTFLEAGFYGIVFLKINSKIINLNRFTYLAKKNFWGFFRISIIIGLIHGSYWIAVPPLLRFISANGINHASVYPSSIAVLSFLIEIFFVFALPLVTIGFFSNEYLKPIRTSFSIVIKHTREITFIILLVLLTFTLPRFFESIIPSDDLLYQNTLMRFITEPLSFLVLIYSFLFLTNNLCGNLKFRTIEMTGGENRDNKKSLRISFAIICLILLLIFIPFCNSFWKSFSEGRSRSRYPEVKSTFDV